jgi:hypothetical protein
MKGLKKMNKNIYIKTFPFKNGNYSLKDFETKIPENIIDLFEESNWKIKIDSNSENSYSSANKIITLKYFNNSLYYYISTFIAYKAGNVERNSNWKTIYNSEFKNYNLFDKELITSQLNFYYKICSLYFLKNNFVEKTFPKAYAYIEDNITSL